MSSFDLAIPVILKHEGGWSDDPSDHGGATNFGLTLRYIVDNIDPTFTHEELEEMSEAVAINIYESKFWKHYNLGMINDQTVATKLFDMIVNLGPSKAVRLAQKACSDMDILINIDGLLGPSTIAALNSANPTKLISNIKQELVHFYTSLVNHDPSQQKFLKGWLARAES